MKLCFRMAAAFACAAIAFSSPARAEEGPFVGLSAGWDLPFDVSFHSKAGATPTSGKLTLRGAAEVSGEFGYILPDGLMLNLEFLHFDFGVGHVIANGTENAVASGSRVTQNAFLANAEYEIPYRDRINWVVGAGAGFAEVSPNILDASDSRLSGNNGSFAWQLLAGANWAVTQVLRLQLDYRFRSVLGTSHTYAGTPVQFGSFSSQALMLSLRWVLVPPA